MERLTGWDYLAGVKTGDILVGVQEQKAFDRLAQIEDVLGDNYNLDWLQRLVEADKDGRCFVSDLKLGDTVYYIPKFNNNPYCGIQAGHVQAISFTRAGQRIKIREYHPHNQDFMLGKSAFITYEDAKVVLSKE